MRAARRPHWTQEKQPGNLHYSGPGLSPALFKAKPCDNHKGFLRPVRDGKLVTLTSARGWRREAGGGATSRFAKKALTGNACAVARHGTSFPPLRLGSGTPNLSPRSRRRRRPPSGAAALPEACLFTFPRTLRRTAAARGREPAETRARRSRETQRFFPPSPIPLPAPSPPKNVPLRVFGGLSFG